MKNKTIAVWLCLLGGPIGLHRWYLRGQWDVVAALLACATVAGGYGIWRARHFGVDDTTSWVLIPLIGFTFAGCALHAIVYGLKSTQAWNSQFNPALPEDSTLGESNKLTVAGLVCALFLGSSVLLASLAFSFQRYFEYQMTLKTTQSTWFRKYTNQTNGHEAHRQIYNHEIPVTDVFLGKCYRPAQARSSKSLICCKAAGSSIVVRSPVSRFSHTACIARRSNLPLRVLGNTLTR
jgi:hypothetical protein